MWSVIEHEYYSLENSFSRYPVVGVEEFQFLCRFSSALDGSSDELHHLLSFTHLTK